MKATFRTLKDGEYHLVPATGIQGKHFHRCCDCGLEHQIKYRLYEVMEKIPGGAKLKRLPLKRYAIATAYWRVK